MEKLSMAVKENSITTEELNLAIVIVTDWLLLLKIELVRQ
jgi:hypothetical protein